MAMASREMFIFLFPIILLNFANITTAQLQTDPCINSANYTTNSTYQSNLESVLSSLPSHTSNNYGFYNTSAGQGNDTVYAIALCRGDVSRDVCRSCVYNATLDIRQLCPNKMVAFRWYGECMLRYSNANIFHRVEGMNYGSVIWYRTSDARSLREFNAALRNLTDRLQDEAATGGSLRKFAMGNISGPDFLNINALMQCTPDLSEEDCSDCLYESVRQIPTYFNGKEGGIVARPSCYHRHEIYDFFRPIAISLPQPPLSAPPSVSPPQLLTQSPPLRSAPAGKSTSTGRTILLVTVPTLSVVILVALIYILMRKWKKRKAIEQDEQTERIPNEGESVTAFRLIPVFCSNIEATVEINTVESLLYRFSTIRSATDDFSESNKLGQGGFGSVYKGRLQNGLKIAVKRLSRSSGQGELEFKNEVLLVARLQHRNLVRLLGFCLEGSERILIYEFVPNASLDQFLFDSAKRINLNWKRRFKIIEGVARGILYLHEDSRLRIIHRDLKASNVLLDAKMNAKIADFGMARLFTPEETQGNTKRIVGTYGYMAPEYARRGRFSVKSDVYSFGVLVLEIVSGRKNYIRNGESYEHLQSNVWKSWRDGKASDTLDPILTQGSRRIIRDMLRCIHIGLLCVQERVADRPTMASIVLMLSSLSITLPVPSQPAFFMNGSINLEMPLLDIRSSKWSVNKVTVTDLSAR